MQLCVLAVVVLFHCPHILFLFSICWQAVDDSGMAGMDRVDSLAECLVELRNQLTMVLTNQQVRIMNSQAAFPLCISKFTL